MSKSKYNKTSVYSVFLNRVVQIDGITVPKSEVRIEGEFLLKLIEQEGEDVIAEAKKV